MFKFYIEHLYRTLHLLYFVLNRHPDFLFELESGPEYYTIEKHVDFDIIFCSTRRLF